MSYNIDSVIISSGSLTIDRDAALAYIDGCEYLPEDTFLDKINKNSPPVVVLNSLAWHGEGSGGTEDDFISLLEMMKGEAELVLIWEGGDSITGLHVKDGVVTDKKVKFVLV